MRIVLPDRERWILSLKAVLTDGKDRCLLLRRSPANRYNVGKWEFPGGKAIRGETLGLALTREVREETGLDIALVRVLGAASSRRQRRPVIYLVVQATSRSTGVQLSEEHDRHRWVPLGDLTQMELAPQFMPIARQISEDQGGTRVPWPRARRSGRRKSSAAVRASFP